jgi:hypothetical protein
VLGIVPISRLLYNDLQNRRKQRQSLCSDQSKHNNHRRLYSSSQLLKRRQLAHGARNRAGQLIEVQRPAKGDEINGNLSGQTTANTPPIVASAPTHSCSSKDS